MKHLLLILFAILTHSLFSQNISNIEKIEPEQDFDNILVKKLDSDSNSTSFIVWIKKNVKSHKHETHSEIIYVIEGTGEMTINRKKFSIVAGDYFRIPEATFHSLKVTSNILMKVLSVQSPEFHGNDRIFEK